MTSDDTTAQHEPLEAYDPAEDDGWAQQGDRQLPPRPRRRLLSPVPVALFSILLLALAFLAGVEVQKNSGSSTSSAAGGGGFGALRRAAAAAAAGASSGSSTAARSAGGGGDSGGFFGAGGPAGGGLTAGEVSYVSGNTLYVTNSAGSTVKVNVPSGTKVGRTVSTSASSIHPGETVIVRGSTSSGGAVTASSITIGSGAAAGGFGGLAAAAGGAGTTAGGGGSSSSSGSTGGAPQLFGGG